MFFVLVLLIIASIPTTWHRLPLGIAVGTGGAALSVLLAWLNGIGTPRDEPKSERWHRRFASGYADLDRREHRIVIMAATFGVLTAWSVAQALGVGHPFWAAVTVAALMPALVSAEVWSRILHLMLGRLGGVAVASILFSFDPGHLALIAIIVVCQGVAEITVARSYGLALLSSRRSPSA